MSKITIATLRKAGLSTEQMLAVLEAKEAESEVKTAKRREQSRVLMAAKRAREKADVSYVSAVSTVSANSANNANIMEKAQQNQGGVSNVVLTQEEQPHIKEILTSTLSKEVSTKESKKTLSMRAVPFPADYVIGSYEIEFAVSKGWNEAYARDEFDRFRDHALAGGRKQVDWKAAWRKWVTSPYQKVASHAKATGAKSIRDIFDDIRAEDRECSQGGRYEPGATVVELLPAGGRSRPGDMGSGGYFCPDAVPRARGYGGH